MTTRHEFVSKVAVHVGGMLTAGDLEERTGLSQDELRRMSDLDRERLEWAIGEVQRRLYRMGKTRP